MRIDFKKLHASAQLPTYGTEGAACFDLQTIDEAVIRPSTMGIFRTGLAAAVPDGWVLLIYSRSGHGFKHGVRLSNAVGVIDSDYRGEIMVALHNDGATSCRIETGDRVAQAMLMPALRCTFHEVDDLDATERGTGGFGSTGR